MDNTKVLRNDLKVYLITAISKKGNPYTALKIETGNTALDKSLKLVFLNELQKVLLDK